MEKLLRELLDKVSEIQANQEKILSHLDDSILYPKPRQESDSEKKKSKKEREEEEREEMIAVIMHAPRIREKFNLAVTPQTHRVIAYLRTGNESAFDGLKRKN
ncbi:hypothetical protein [Salinimicrobium sp. GXAS 041]|uniref:hypothetical protein n=1 Tax=Salinimicrobium sp. GXAS 041 TaxID=3400806 RepID=UPI003C723140